MQLLQHIFPSHFPLQPYNSVLCQNVDTSSVLVSSHPVFLTYILSDLPVPPMCVPPHTSTVGHAEGQVTIKQMSLNLVGGSRNGLQIRCKVMHPSSRLE